MFSCFKGFCGILIMGIVGSGNYNQIGISIQKFVVTSYNLCIRIKPVRLKLIPLQKMGDFISGMKVKERGMENFGRNAESGNTCFDFFHVIKLTANSRNTLIKKDGRKVLPRE